MTSLDTVWIHARRSWRCRPTWLPRPEQFEFALGAALWLVLIVMAGQLAV